MMIKNILNIILSVSILELFAGCDNFEFPPTPYPRVETLPATDVSVNGATLNSKIIYTGKNAITGYGFEWGLEKTKVFSFNNKVTLDYYNESDSLKYDLSYGLYSDTSYKVRAFIKTEKYLVYGEILSFRSYGSNPPVIKSFSPAEGTWGDTVTICGKYFSQMKDNIKISFGTFNSEILSWNDSVLKCEVPLNIPDKTVTISVTVIGRKAQADEKFILQSPVISSLSSNAGTFDDTIRITGKNFNSAILRNIVKFNENTAQVLLASPTSLSVIIPRTIRASSNKITVNVNLQTSVEEINFNILPPIISSISPLSGLTGSTIQISGNNFNPQTAGNIVFLGSLTGVIQSSSKNKITILVPAGTYKSRSNTIEVKVVGLSGLSSSSFTLTNTWIKKAYVPHQGSWRHSATAFSLNGKGYVGLGDGYPEPGKNFWSYNATINEWSEIAPFPGENRQVAASFTINGKAYVGAGDGPKDFWCYDPSTNSWTRIADFPAPCSLGITIGFSVNNKGYVVTKNKTANFWEYEPVSNAWTNLSDLPMPGDYYYFTPDAGFVIDDMIYVYVADGTTDDNRLYMYNISDGTWTRKADIAGSQLDSWTTGFAVKGNGYIRAGSNLYKYDPLTDKWTRMLQQNNLPGGRGRSIAFVINDLAYFGTSFYGSGESAWDFWEFNPDYENK
jgi:hypothetical protein